MVFDGYEFDHRYQAKTLMSNEGRRNVFKSESRKVQK
jgi:hypothetical protein